MKRVYISIEAPEEQVEVSSIPCGHLCRNGDGLVALKLNNKMYFFDPALGIIEGPCIDGLNMKHCENLYVDLGVLTLRT